MRIRTSGVIELGGNKMTSQRAAITGKALGHTHITAAVSVPEVPNQLHPPIPPWRVHLEGEKKDLQDLATEHSLGRIRVLHLEGDYFLESHILDRLPNPDHVYREAKELLRLIFGLARIRRFEASPVKALSVLWTDGNGNWVCRRLVASEELWVVPSTRYLEGANISERILTLAETNEVVRMNLIDFVGDWDFSRLRRIADSILIDLGGGKKKKGVAEVLRLGWATQAECARFDETVNFGHKELHGAHSALELAAGQNKNPLNLVEAAEFLRILLARWLASKTNSEVIPRDEGVRFHDPKR
jgi:hypothetical protein